MHRPPPGARRPFRSSLTPLCLAAMIVAGGPAAGAGFDPRSFTAIATIPTGEHVIRLVIDTDTLSAQIIGGSTNGRYVGQVFSPGSGLPDVAVFTFGALSSSQLNLVLSGSRPVAILSQSDMTIGDVTVGLGTLGGGAGGQVRFGETYTAAQGPGAGGREIGSKWVGSGGGFGGAGGAGAGGAPYGDLMLALQGGSGGGPSDSRDPGASGFSNGGYGGGAIELGAVGSLTVGTVTADGGGFPRSDGTTAASNGGGGSGGAILLHGAQVKYTALSARGGAGGTLSARGGDIAGGGGGGGRILVQENDATLTLTAAGKPVNGDAAGGSSPDPTRKGQGGQLTYVAGTVQLDKATAVLTGNRIAYGDAAATHEGPDQKGELNDVGFLRLAIGPSATVNAATLDGMTGSIDLSGRLVVAGAVDRRADIALMGGTLVAGGGYRLAAGESFAGYGIIAGKVRGAVDSRFVAQGGALTLGERSSFSGFITDGEIDVGADSVELLARGFATLGHLTTIGGGRLSAPGGVVLLGGRAIEGSGVVNTRVAAHAGSTIEATGVLDLGSDTASDGFFSEGQLHVGRHAVKLHDRNEAVLGSITTIGGGTLKGVNGLLIGEGRNLEGFGRIEGTVVNQGSVFGETADAPDIGSLNGLLFGGDVTGRGSFGGDVAFLGTYSPGNSPAIVTHENTSFGADARVVIEIGGLIPGEQHDRIDVTGNVALDGTLELALIDGFAPQAGQRFEILRYGTRDGAFAALAGTGLAPGLFWTLDYQDHALFAGVQAVPEPQTWALFGVGIACLAMLRRRR